MVIDPACLLEESPVDKAILPVEPDADVPDNMLTEPEFALDEYALRNTALPVSDEDPVDPPLDISMLPPDPLAAVALPAVIATSPPDELPLPPEIFTSPPVPAVTIPA
jgi:hypothetical protein